MICNDTEAGGGIPEDVGYVSLPSAPSAMRERRDHAISSNLPYDRGAVSDSTSLLAAIANELRMSRGSDEGELRLEARRILEGAFRSFEHSASYGLMRNQPMSAAPQLLIRDRQATTRTSTQHDLLTRTTARIAKRGETL